MDVKYVDGPVVFTFEIIEREGAPPGQLELVGHISNASSLPLAIYGLELEIEPGRTAFEPLYRGTAPLVTVEARGSAYFALADVRVEAPADLLETPKTPRLLVNNAGVDPTVQQFWDGLRSAPALSGPVTLTAAPGDPAIVSDFEGAGAEFQDRWGIGPQAPGYGVGWFLPVDVAEYFGSGGNPDGCLSWQGDQRDWWFFATHSNKYAGDRSFAYGRNLAFDLKAEIAAPNDDFFIPLVVLSGTDANGNPVHLFQRQAGHPTPGTEWTHYSIPLNQAARWRIATSPSLALAVEATGEDIRQVLSTLTSLRIRGEYGGFRYRGYLDNVVLGAP